MNPLKRAVALSSLNVLVLLVLRFDDLSRVLFAGKEIVLVEITGSHFAMFWVIGMLMILFTALVAGKLSLPNTHPFRHLFRR
ncbi:MAG: hypothetical protein ACREOI_06430 [bacterium]